MWFLHVHLFSFTAVVYRCIGEKKLFLKISEIGCNEQRFSFFFDFSLLHCIFCGNLRGLRICEKKSTHIQAEMRTRCVNKHKQVALIFALKGINIIREMSRGGFFRFTFSSSSSHCFLSLSLSPVIPKDSTADLTKKSLPTCFFSSPSFFLCFYYVHFLFIFSKSLFSFPFLSWGHGCLVFYGRFFCTILFQNSKVFRWGGVGGQECNS